MAWIALQVFFLSSFGDVGVFIKTVPRSGSSSSSQYSLHWIAYVLDRKYCNVSCKKADFPKTQESVTHEGTSEVKRTRLNALSHEYELFRMFPHESICDMQKKWQPKVTAIMESKDVDYMSLATLFGKLQEHEMELQRLTLHEQTDENKSRSQEVRSDHEESDSDIDDETVFHLVNKFKKLLRKKGGFRRARIPMTTYLAMIVGK
ncbi:hypothetical protein Lal_00033478 [Lupinus albus]|nr:hypothetical protein Lal_00033478 [Lupinus albus]